MLGLDFAQISEMIPKMQKMADEVVSKFNQLQKGQDEQKVMQEKMLAAMHAMQMQQKLILNKITEMENK